LLTIDKNLWQNNLQMDLDATSRSHYYSLAKNNFPKQHNT
jgi:hypothetical protein